MRIDNKTDVAAVYLNTNTFWFQIEPGTFRKDSETYDHKICEWVDVYAFDYRVPRTSEVRTMQVVATTITAVQHH